MRTEVKSNDPKQSKVVAPRTRRAKKFPYFFGNSKTIRTFVVPKTRISGITKSYERSLSVFLLHFYTRSRGSLARLRDTLSFCIY